MHPLRSKVAPKAGEVNRSDLYRSVRAAFIMQGTSLSEWCRAQGVTRQYAEKVLKGEKRGPSAQAFKQRVVAASGVQ